MAIPVDFTYQIPTVTLGSTPSTLFTSVDASSITTIGGATIDADLFTYQIPSVTLGSTPTTLFTTVGSSSITSIGGATIDVEQFSYKSPESKFGGVASTFVFTSNEPISLEQAAPPGQIWYFS